MALRLRLKTARLAAQLDHVVDEPWRNTVMPRRLAMAVPFINKRNNTIAQLYRMWFTHQ